MPSTASPFGLRPIRHPSGVIRQEAGTILTGYATTLLQFCPVAILADGSLGIAATTARTLGAFMGVEYIDSNGRRVLTNRWLASTTATEIVAYFTRDPAIIYEIQSNGAVSLVSVGSQLNWGTATAGNSTTGLSEVVALSSSLTSTASAGLRILGLGRSVDNAWGDSFVNLEVQISEHQEVASRVADA